MTINSSGFPAEMDAATDSIKRCMRIMHSLAQSRGGSAADAYKDAWASMADAKRKIEDAKAILRHATQEQTQ